jgi:hypothetical protein
MWLLLCSSIFCLRAISTTAASSDSGSSQRRTSRLPRRETNNFSRLGNSTGGSAGREHRFSFPRLAASPSLPWPQLILLPRPRSSDSTVADSQLVSLPLERKRALTGVSPVAGGLLGTATVVSSIFYANSRTPALAPPPRSVVRVVARVAGIFMAATTLLMLGLIPGSGTADSITMSQWMALESVALIVALVVGHVPSILTACTIFVAYLFLWRYLDSLAPDQSHARFVALFPICVLFIANGFAIGYQILEAFSSTRRDLRTTAPVRGQRFPRSL